jgi:hypothetical protein
MLLVVGVTAFALISLMFLLMVRVTDPLMPRMMFGVLNTVLYFPSGAVYPQAGFPGWMQASRASIRSPTPSTRSRACCSRTPDSTRSPATCCSCFIFSAIAMTAATRSSGARSEACGDKNGSRPRALVPRPQLTSRRANG